MYLISEEELFDYLFKKLFDYLSTSNDVGHLIINRGLICERWADEFLKDKKPVTEIASGTVTSHRGYFGEKRALLDGWYYKIEPELLKRIGKTITIYEEQND